MTAKLQTYDVPTSAKLLSISEREVYRLLAKKKLRKVKIGRRTVIRETELERYLESRTR